MEKRRGRGGETERERERAGGTVSVARRQQMELAGSLVGPSREIEVAFLRAY